MLRLGLGEHTADAIVVSSTIFLSMASLYLERALFLVAKDFSGLK